MRFFHGTDENSWKAIQDEGILYGRRYVTNSDGEIIKEVDRCTYLACDKEDAALYGPIILEVEYNPASSKLNNYIEGCWQMRVYEPIPMNNIKRIN